MRKVDKRPRGYFPYSSLLPSLPPSLPPYPPVSMCDHTINSNNDSASTAKRFVSSPGEVPPAERRSRRRA